MKVYNIFEQKENGAVERKLGEWAKLGINNSHHIPTVGSVYEEPDNKYFEDYVKYINNNNRHQFADHVDVPEHLIPSNPPPVPVLIEDDENANFMRNFKDATYYILFAASACQKLRVSDELTRRSNLRWFSVLADLYDQYRSVLSKVASLKNGDKKVEQAANIAEDVRKNKLKRKVLAKEVMAGQRLNKILEKLHGQWHIIELHDYITREFLINNSQDFFDKLIDSINWPKTHNKLPYILWKRDGSSYQYTLRKKKKKGYANDQTREDALADVRNANDQTSLTLPVTKFRIYKARKDNIFVLAVPESLENNENNNDNAEDNSTEDDSVEQDNEDKSKDEDIVYISSEDEKDEKKDNEKDNEKDDEKDNEKNNEKDDEKDEKKDNEKDKEKDDKK